jgi:hypothetical protein
MMHSETNSMLVKAITEYKSAREMLEQDEGKLTLQQGTSDIQILKLMVLHVENKEGWMIPLNINLHIITNN